MHASRVGKDGPEWPGLLNGEGNNYDFELGHYFGGVWECSGIACAHATDSMDEMYLPM